MKFLMKIFFVALLFIAGKAVLFAQYTSPNSMQSETGKQNKASVSTFVPDYWFSLGTSFSSFTPGISFFGTYYNIEEGSKVVGRLRLSVGVGFSTFFVGYTKSSRALVSNPELSFGSIYVKGEYAVSKSITVTALGHKTMDLRPFLTGEEQLNPHALDLSNQGMMINLNYKVNDNFQIDASFSYDRGHYNPYYYNHMMNEGFNNPAMGVFRGYRPGF